MSSEDRILQDAPEQSVAAGIRAAVVALFEVDAFLFEVDANERSITRRLAVHLAQCFPDWHVDCEYNRDGFNPKMICPSCGDTDSTDTNGSRVYPDIVIHHRGRPENLVLIEVKKSTSRIADDTDLAKLRTLRSQLLYSHALFLRFSCGTATPCVEQVVWC